MKVQITVEFKPLPRKRRDGWVEEVDESTYKVFIDSRNGLALQRKSWLHETGLHIPNYIWGRTVDEEREHRFIAAMERDYEKNWKKHMEGK